MNNLKNKICSNCSFWTAYVSRKDFGICTNPESTANRKEMFEKSYCDKFKNIKVTN